MLPTEGDRARRWANVMGWYAPAAHTVPHLGGDDVVISVGDCEELGRLAATALNRAHEHVPSFADAAPASRGVNSVLLVAVAAHCGLRALAPALDAWALGQTHVGLLTGRDHAGIAFSMAKILAARTSHRARAAGTAILDGPAGRAHRFPTDTSQLRLDEALAGDWLSMLVDAHGSNAHAWLGSHVLCGLSTDHEHTLSGEPIPGGCTDRRCKLAPNGELTSMHPHQLRAALLSLFVCNAITLAADEQYPSTVSLALDALDGYPAAVLGLLRGDADTTALEPAVAAHLLHAETSLGETAWLLNQALALRGSPHAMLVLGDPTHTPPGTIGARIPAVQLDASTRLPVIIDDDGAVPALITPAQALLARPPSSSTRAVDAQLDADELTADLRGWMSRLAEAHLAEVVLAESNQAAAAASDLATLRSMRDSATQHALAAIRHLEQLSRFRASGFPADPRPELDKLAERWATTLMTLAIQSPSAMFSDLADALTAHHHLTNTTPAGECEQCGAPRHRLHYTGPAPVAHRTEWRCPRCGLLRSAPDNATAVMLRTPPHLAPGQPATIECLVDGDHTAPCVLSVQLRTRSASRAAYASDTHRGSAGRHSVTLDIPAETEPELHRAWVTVACRFQLSVAIARIPAIPPYDAKSSIRTEEHE
jgi:hypothetical protein